MLGALVIGLCTSSWAAAGGSNVIAGVKSIGGYPVSAKYTLARQIFGGPYSETQSGTTCLARWGGGLTIAWQRRLPYAKWDKACVTFSWAKMSGKLWRTDKGLRVGSSETQLRRLYASATRQTSGGYTMWRLAAGSSISLQAWAKNGRVSFFRIVRG